MRILTLRLGVSDADSSLVMRLGGHSVTISSKMKPSSWREVCKNLACSKAVVLNVWVATPLGVEYQKSCISDIYIIICNSDKSTTMK